MRAIRIVDILVLEVLEGKWGNGSVRREQLIPKGYGYQTVQDRGNEIIKNAITGWIHYYEFQPNYCL